MVAVDSAGFYEDAIGMQELCYCVGVASVHENGIYAAHVSPGELGKSPEDLMSDFKEGNQTYIVAGVQSQEYDPKTLETIIYELENDVEIFKAREFALDQDGEIFDSFEEESRRSPLSPGVL